MDIKEIDLRRSDFEAMHPVAKLFNFDHEKLTYFGDAYDDARRLNDLWSTWCACVGLLYLETNTAKAQTVLEGFKVVSFKQISELVVAVNKVDLMTHTEQKTNEVRLAWQDIASKLQAVIEVQEQKG